MAGFMRGTTLIALIDATFITIGLVALGGAGRAGAGRWCSWAPIPFVGAFLSRAVSIWSRSPTVQAPGQQHGRSPW